MGVAIRTRQPLDLYFPPMLWRMILDPPHEPSDSEIASIDFATIDGLKKLSAIEDSFDFEDLEMFFVSQPMSHPGIWAPLKPGGSSIMISRENLAEYRHLVVTQRRRELRDGVRPLAQ